METIKAVSEKKRFVIPKCEITEFNKVVYLYASGASDNDVFQEFDELWGND